MVQKAESHLEEFFHKPLSTKENKDNFERIFREYYPWLVNYGSRILHDAELAKDLVQETFYKLWDNQKLLEPSLSIKAYLFKALYTACIDQLRHKKVEERFINEALQEFYFNEIIQTPEAELKLIDSNIRELLQNATKKLPEKCRQIFVLSKFEGMSNKEIALQLNLSVKTVENQMTIALSRLRKEIDWLVCFVMMIR